MDQQPKHATQDGDATSVDARPLAQASATVLPVIEERLKIGRRVHETGAAVRVRKIVEQRQVTVDEPLWREHVEIERVPVGREVETAPPTRYEGEVTIVPIVEEVLVIERRLVLKEEVRIVRRREAHAEPRSVTLRTERAVVERRDSPDGPWYPLDEASAAVAMPPGAPAPGAAGPQGR